MPHEMGHKACGLMICRIDDLLNLRAGVCLAFLRISNSRKRQKENKEDPS